MSSPSASSSAPAPPAPPARSPRLAAAAGPVARPRRVVLPPRRPDMRTLDKSAFDLRLDVLAARVPAGRSGIIRSAPIMRGHVLAIDKVKAIVADPDPARRRLLLQASDPDELPDNVREFLAAEGAEYVPDSVTLGWEHWTPSQILDAVLPFAGAEETPAAYTQAGHIAHMNLRPEWLPYKRIVGEVILDKAPHLRTVVNKIGEIHAEFRFFDMEVIAGDEDFVTTLSENGSLFKFDFSRVYWNSRLAFEHERILSLLEPGEAVADVMAGVGPFAVPAARKGCYVWANDLNPESVRWMRENRALNKVESTLAVSEIDGRAFIRAAPLDAWRRPFARVAPPVSAKQRLRAERRERDARLAAGRSAALPAPAPAPAPAAPAAPASPPAPAPQTIAHYIMNLPDTALTFLDAFRGSHAALLGEPGYDRAAARMPTVHVHCFTREMQRPAAEADICERASAALGHALTPATPGYALHLVRSVAPTKHMYCLAFRLPEEVAYGEAAASAA